MFVYQGNYPRMHCLWDTVNLLKYLGVSEERCVSIDRYLEESLVNKIFGKFGDRKPISIVKIHKYDTWNMDCTLSTIILPMLKQLQATKHGAPHVKDEDVPEEIRNNSTELDEEAFDVDSNHFKRWDYVLSEMIWSFEQMQPGNNWENQFLIGKFDYSFEYDSSDGIPGSKLVLGPNNTHKFDREGYDKYSDRISNGLRLFGSYYRNLWD